jgi:hypothetical protein
MIRYLTLALVALKDAHLQVPNRMRRPPNQMRIAAALVAAKRCNKFVILHKKGMLFHARPQPQAQRERGACAQSSAPAPHSAVAIPRQAMVRAEDGRERATAFSAPLNRVMAHKTGDE